MTRTRRKRRPAASMTHLVLGLDGGPLEEFQADCPLCALLAAAGAPIHTAGHDGRLVELPAPPLEVLEALEITVVADAAVAPIFGVARRTLRLPVGCIVSDFLQCLGFLEPDLKCAFPLEAMRVFVDGAPAWPNQVLCHGDRVILGADRPADLTFRSARS